MLALEQRLSPALLTLLLQAGGIAVGHGYGLYLVGGLVRDSLLLDPHKFSPRTDLDVVVEGDALALVAHLQADYGGTLQTHPRFGTATWTLAQAIPLNASTTVSALDVAVARTESYARPAALPDVQPSTIRQDLFRRDFTINAMAVSLMPVNFGQLLDLYGGHTDLDAGLVRVLHSHSFIDDPTRIFRAVRFMSRLGFALEPETLALLNAGLDGIALLSGARITHEFDLIFQETSPARILTHLAQLNTLRQIHPRLTIDTAIREAITQLAALPAPWQSRVPQAIHHWGILTFHLSRDDLDAVMTRLTFSNANQTILTQAHAIKDRAGHLASATQASAIYQLLADTTADAQLIAWLMLDECREAIARFVADQLHSVSPLIDGHYLKQTFHLSPGPIYRQIIDALRTARLDGVVNTLAEEHALVEQILSQRGVLR